MPVNGGEVPFERAVLMPLNVGIAHPSGMLAESLASVLVSEPDIQLVWSARDGISVRSLLRGRVCDVLICAQQIEPDGCDGVISYVGDAGLPTSIVVLVDTEIGDQLRDAVSSTGGQAPALVQHFSTVSTLVEAIRAAAAGRTFVDPLLVPELLLRERPHAETLTPRETAVLDELSLGLSNKEIAIALSVTIETVKTHVKNVMRKLEVTNRTAAVLQAAQRSAATAAESYNELAAVVDSGNDAIVTKNPLGLITSWNAGATRMYGYSADEVVWHVAAAVHSGRAHRCRERRAHPGARGQDGTALPDCAYRQEWRPARRVADHVAGARRHRANRRCFDNCT